MEIVGKAAVLDGIWSITDDNIKPKNRPAIPPKKPILNAMTKNIMFTFLPEKPVAFRIAMESIFS